MASSAEASNSTLTPSDDAKKEVIPPSSATSTIPKEVKPSDEMNILTGSLDDLTLKGHFDNKKPVERVRGTTTKPHKVERCARCFAPATSRCERCAASWYCSAECQLADWDFHKRLCSQFKNHKERPDASYVRAILFPDDDKSPRFIWLQTNDTVLDLDNLDEKLELKRLLGVEKIGQQQVATTRNYCGQLRPTTNPTNTQTHLLLREECFVDGSKPNKSIGMITQGCFHFSWRGPIVAIVTSPEDPSYSDTDPVLFDATTTDYRGLIGFFASYGQYVEGEEDFAPMSLWWMAPVLLQDLISQPQIQVIQISSDVEAIDTDTKYSPFCIGENHPAMAFLQPSPLTVELGFPLVIRRFPTDKVWREESEATGNVNSGPSFLFFCIDPQSRYWGRMPKNSTQGTVVAMRHDRKDLHPHHLETIIAYLVRVFGPAIDETLGPEPKRGRKQVLEMLHPSRLDWYFKTYRKENSNLDERWKNTPPMFETDASLGKKTDGT